MTMPALNANVKSIRPSRPSSGARKVYNPRVVAPLRVQARRSERGLHCRAAAEEAEAGSGIEKAGNDFKAVLDINKVMEILPHRFPFLLVDKVIEYKQGEYAVAVKNVTINDNYFPGHFPQRPIMPGVLMVEAMAQVGGIVLLNPEETGEQNNNFFFGGVDKCRFRKPVVPGDTLHMKVTLGKLNKRFGMAKMQGYCYVGENLVCEAELTLVLGQ